MNTKKWAGIAFLFIGISIVGNVILYQFGHSPFNLANIDQSESVSIEGVHDIYVQSNIGNIEIRTYEGDEIAVRISGKTEQKRLEDYELILEQSGESLRIEAKKKVSLKLISIFPDFYDLIIQLPQKEYENLQVNSEVANINVIGVQAKKLILKTDVGTIYGEKIVAEIDASSEVGEIDFILDELHADLKGRSSVGNLHVHFTKRPTSIRTDLRSSLGSKTDHLVEQTIGENEIAPLVELITEVGNVSVTTDK